MGAAKTIVRNALFSYGRTIVAAALTLFSSRWVLAELGASDYGIYGLIGSVLLFIGFISSVLNQGANRYMAFSEGSDSHGTVQEWFNTTANIYFCLPVVLMPIGLIVGEVLIRYVLNIPDSRVPAACWLLRFALISLTGLLISMPYQSLMVAKQYIHISAMILLWHAVGMFVIGYILPHMPGDHLVVYGLLVTLSLLIKYVLDIAICRRLCKESRIQFSMWWNFSRLKQMSMFSGWMFLGAAGLLLKNQGISILVNWMRGTIANAGQGIGIQLAGQTESLYNALVMALNPEVTRRAGAGGNKQMMDLAQRSTRLGLLIVLLVGVPLFFECEYVLKLWLKDPPVYAVFFTRVQIVLAIFNKMRIGHMMCFTAAGSVKPIQILDACFYVSTIILIGIAYLVSGSLEISFYAYLAFHFVYLVSYLYVGSKYFDWPLGAHMRDVVLPGLLICAVGAFVFRLILLFLPEQSFLRVLLSSACLSAVTCCLMCAWVFTVEDNRLIIASFKNFAKRIF